MTPLTRRKFVGMTAAVAAAAALPSLALAQPAKRPPNVIVIVSDDQGAADLGCYGSRDILTPNLDALAARGVRFTQFYAAGAMCSPSRAAILTGLYPQRAGLPGNAPSQPGPGGLRADATTIAQMLNAAGYSTAHIGKWHLGYSKPTMPNARGFDYSFGFMGGCVDNYSHFYYWGGPNRHDLHRNGSEVWYEGQYLGDLLVREASQFIEKNKDRPFFIYYAINKPHYPLQGTQKWREHYKNLPEPRAMYAAAVSTLDDEIGRVLAKLDELNLRDDTIVIFQSDQGHSTEDRAFSGGGNAGPYRGAKGCFFEGAIRMPAIISWPGHLPQGQTRNQFCTACDWLTTIADLANLKPPAQLTDGKSLSPIARSPDAPSPHAVFHWAMGNQWAVREADWKLLGNPTDPASKSPLPADDKLFLVNLRDDPSESKNLAKQHPLITQRMLQLHEQWAKELRQQS